jgi:hypothetical protein
VPGGRKNGLQGQNETRKPRQKRAENGEKSAARTKSGANQEFFRSLFSRAANSQKMNVGL